MKVVRFFLIIVSIGIISHSCTDGDPTANEFVSYDIVQVAGMSDNATYYTVYRPDSDEAIVYEGQPGFIDTTEVHPGDRVLLSYVPSVRPYVGGAIDAISYSRIFNSTATTTEEFTDSSGVDWVESGVYVYSMWRGGPYLNIHGKAVFTDKGATMRLTYDKADVEAETSYPELTVKYMTAGSVNNFQRDFYASFYIGALWDADWCRGISVNVDNTNLDKNTFQFIK